MTSTSAGERGRQAEGIVATIEREPLIICDNTISKSRFTAEDASLPTKHRERWSQGAGIYQTSQLRHCAR
jgi:hypothetical protein